MAAGCAYSRLRAALDDLVDGAHRVGVLRSDFTSADVPLLLEHVTARIPVTDERAATLHLRYLDLVLAGLGGTQRAVERIRGLIPAPT